ncbi:MAG: HPr(Ser) kinase/phosphatase [Ruminococcaceae bacterium]|nr:HPr(Ser) kinase/phosphatase [Oscillospiraceae bacterium]
MSDLYVVLSKIIDEQNLEIITAPEGYQNIHVCIPQVNRPGLQLSGFFDYFDPERIQIIGRVEHTYLEKMDSDERYIALRRFFNFKPVAVVVTQGLDIYPEMERAAKESRVPLLRSTEITSQFMSNLILSLNVWLAPMTTFHGVLVEVYGEGILLLGESGVGKSETAMELVKRGHRLVADDAVEIKKVSKKTLVGSSPAIIRHFIELRGIGVVDVKQIFGMGAVKDTENINLVINLEPWQSGKQYDRLGLDTETTNIMGIEIPSLTIPVKPGRNLAIIIEVAAMNHRQKKMGYNAAKELNRRLIEQTDEEITTN